MSNPSVKPVLLRFDVGHLKRIELEVSATVKERAALGDHREVARTEVIRDLITEALDARCARRHDGVPYVVPVSSRELFEGSEEVSTIVDVEKVRGEPLLPAAPIVDRTSEKVPEWFKPIQIPSVLTIEEQDGKMMVLTSAPNQDRGPSAEVRVVRTPEEMSEEFSVKPGTILFVPRTEVQMARGPAGNSRGNAGRTTLALLATVAGMSGLSLGDVLEGTTAGAEGDEASVEGDASEGRSGGVSEPVAEAVGEGGTVEVPEVGTAGGRGWLGNSVKRIGV